ncbi:elmo ced-12 family protein [Zymoseptoria brevis]|uniref:Elmo ced-12 family protein n=1 Tax=Zymoseptoria brevis TaxID=1047168 RepID=A0A0F4G8T2_9PEZI|nr:elmo ced-12 family protein [Zymoseptoria brevis]
MDEPPDVETLVAGLVADSDSARKYAVFKLKGLLGDPSFADAFIRADGLPALREAVLETTGNMQAYALGSLDALLELDTGWECCDDMVLEKVVSLSIHQPLVNIVRNALTLLVLVVSRPATSNQQDDDSPVYGFRAIKPAVDQHPEFLESLVQRLSASDHTLCANALQLINALMRDAIFNGGEHEWPRFVKRLQDLGVIGGVGILMRGDAAHYVDSPLASAILEFQSLTQVLLRKWRDVAVKLDLAEHKRALKTIHLLSKPEPYIPGTGVNGGKVKKHHPEKWRRLGFETESPAWEFEETGYLGMMDLVEYARRNEEAYVKTLTEQAAQPREQRCPVARASLSVTLILYEHFEIDDATAMGFNIDERVDQSVERLYKPLLLQWGRLHTAGLHAFFRIWKDSGAQEEDFFKIEEVVRITIEHIVGFAPRKADVSKVEEELRGVSLETARKWQMDSLAEVYQDAWGPHLVQVREQLHHESLQFMKEQRIRCMLQGSWFPVPASDEASWRYVRLSHNRRWLHYQNYTSKGDDEPPLADLTTKIDLNTVTSVDSNVSASEPPIINVPNRESSSTLKNGAGLEVSATTKTTNTKITILGNTATGLRARSTTLSSNSANEEEILLELFPSTPSLASEWLDGLLMLLNQQPITKDTARLVEMMEDWGARLRMLNLRWEDVDWEALEANERGGDEWSARPVPGREGVSDEYWYALPDDEV